jgi:hypothetical protein
LEDCEGTDAAGLAFGPGWVFGGAAGGFIAAAGWLCASESWPSTAFGFGVVLMSAAGVALAFAGGEAAALPAGEAEAFGAAEVCGAATGDAATTGPPVVGFLSANSTMVNFIA